MVPRAGLPSNQQNNNLGGGGTLISPTVFRQISEGKVPPDESPGPEKRNPAAPASAHGADIENQDDAQDTPEPPEAQGRDWSWTLDDSDVIVPTQLAIAVYELSSGRICIRQEADSHEPEDSYILLHPQHLDALIDRLTLIKRHLDGAK